MVRFCLLAIAVVCLGASSVVYGQNNNNNNGGFSNGNSDRQSNGQQLNQQHPQLLSYDQQQELLNQLAQLQRQTQQLLAAQQSLAAVAAAAASNNNNNNNGQHGSNRQQSSQSSANQQSGNNQRQSQSSGNLLQSQQRNPQQQPAASSQQSQSASLIQQKPPQSQQSGHISNHQPEEHPISNQISSQSAQTNQAPPLPAGPQINWGKCPELEPSESEKLAKAGVITKCLETTPLPTNITRESVEQHREQIAACALRAEGWFTGAGGYDFGKAEKEIKNKHLHKDLESQVLSYHSQCKTESEEKYPLTSSSIIAQIQLYQACMDYFISDVCGIEVNEPEAQQF